VRRQLVASATRVSARRRRTQSAILYGVSAHATLLVAACTTCAVTVIISYLGHLARLARPNLLLFSPVTPYVQFNVSKEVAKLGSNVTISCSAESYPPANSVNFFQLQDPSKKDIPHSQLTLVDTGVEYHIDLVNRSHGGEYECSVSIEDYSQGLQSNTAEETLIVYGES